MIKLLNKKGGGSSVVERLPSKEKVAGSNPVRRSYFHGLKEFHGLYRFYGSCGFETDNADKVYPYESVQNPHQSVNSVRSESIRQRKFA
jgi:hypothetical protein